MARSVAAARPKAADVATLVAVVAELVSPLVLEIHDEKREGQEKRQFLTLPRTRVCEVAQSIINPRTARSPSATQARDDGQAFPALQPVVFDTLTGDIRSTRLKQH